MGKKPDFISSAPYDAVQEREDNRIGRKIAEIRRQRGYSLTAFAELLSGCGLTVHRQGIGKWETGDSVPNAYQLLAICRALDIPDGLEWFAGSSGKAPELNAEGLRKVEEYRSDLIASGRYRPQHTVRLTEIRYIEMPVSLLPASAGTGEFLDEENFETLRFPADSVPAGADFGVRVSGDSMEPVYHDGQIVWIRECTSLLPGEDGLFIYDGDGYVKRYEEQDPSPDLLEEFTGSDGTLHRQPVLISYNNHYAPRPVRPDADFRIAGRVLH